MAEKQVMEERGPDLDWEEDFRISDDMQQRWKEAEEEDMEDGCKFHALSLHEIEGGVDKQGVFGAGFASEREVNCLDLFEGQCCW